MEADEDLDDEQEFDEDAEEFGDNEELEEGGFEDQEFGND